jgi:hypothetical protein
MAGEDTTSIRHGGKALIPAALVAATLALGGAMPAGTLTTGGATATATVAGPDELRGLVFGETGDGIHEGQSAISDEDDCSVARVSSRCTPCGWAAE